MTRKEHRAAAVAAWLAFQAEERADTRPGFAVRWIPDLAGQGKHIRQGAAISRAVAAAVAARGYVPRWLDVDRHTRVDLEALCENGGGHSAPSFPRKRWLRLEELSGDDRLDAYESRGFLTRFDPARLP